MKMGRVVQREGRDLWLACMSCENVGQKDNVVLEKVWKRSGDSGEEMKREQRELRGVKKSKEEGGKDWERLRKYKGEKEGHSEPS